MNAVSHETTRSAEQLADAPTVVMPVSSEVDDTIGAGQGLGGLIGDVGLPLGTYYGLHALGVADTPALVAATAAAAVRVAVVALRSRRLSALATLMLGVYGLGLVLSFVSGDPHLVLAKNSVGTAVIGVAFLASLLGSRPLLLTAMYSVRPRQARELARGYVTEPAVRRTMRGMTAMWGVGLSVEAIVRIPVVFALPVDVGVGVSELLMALVCTLLAAATAVWVRAARRTGR